MQPTSYVDGCFAALDGNEETQMTQDRLYAVRLVWVRDPGLFGLTPIAIPIPMLEQMLS